jgi:ankyrin repeat protein
MITDPTETMMFNCAKEGKLNTLSTEILTEKNLVGFADYSGWTPLHYASQHGNLNQVPENILNTKNLEIQDKTGWTSIHCAAAYGHFNQIPQNVLTEKTY